MKSIIVLFISMLVAFNATAADGEVTVYTGVTHFHTAGDGRWYQEAFPNTLNVISPSFTLEYATKKRNGRQYVFNYMYVGKVSSTALAVGNDDNYDRHAHKCLAQCDILAQFNGHGNVQALSGLSRHYYGDWFAEAGLSISRPTWEVDIPDWTDGKATRFHLHVSHKPKLLLLPVVAVGFKKNNITVKLSIVPTSAHGDDVPALYNLISPNLSVGYTF